MSVRDTLRRIQFDIWINSMAAGFPVPPLEISQNPKMSLSHDEPELNGNVLVQERKRGVSVSLYPKNELEFVILRVCDNFEAAITAGRLEVEVLKLAPISIYPPKNLAYGPPTHRRWPRSRSHHYQPSRK